MNDREELVPADTVSRDPLPHRDQDQLFVRDDVEFRARVPTPTVCGPAPAIGLAAKLVIDEAEAESESSPGRNVHSR